MKLRAIKEPSLGRLMTELGRTANLAMSMFAEQQTGL